MLSCGCGVSESGEEGRGRGEREDMGWWNPLWQDSPGYNPLPHNPMELHHHDIIIISQYISVLQEAPHPKELSLNDSS